uniref:Monoglyceride lipase n=1 Tax=Lepeophtheirus salmonis TaxID=72036 RepID=C1BSS3_LEPSM|nr:Monoglyceride lipase [Lepeophtheirus salmonis]
MEESLASFFNAPEASETKEVPSSKGGTLFARYWKVRNPRALVFISHGFTEHSKYYNEIASFLNAKGLYCFGHDHIGHGKSSGNRTFINSIDEFVDDVILHINIPRKDNDYSSIPLFLLGHSMGGMIALRATLMYPDMFKGVVFVGPLIIPGPNFGRLDFRVNSRRAPIVRSFLKVLDTFNPEFIIGKIQLEKVSRDKDLREFMTNDDLKWNKGAKVRTILAMVDCIEGNYNLLGSMKTPFLSLHGDKDELCNVIGSRNLMRKAFVEDKILIEFPEAVHNLFMDTSSTRLKSIQSTVEWFDKRC